MEKSDAVATGEPHVEIREFLDHLEAARPWLLKVGFADPAAAHRNFVALAELGIPLDLLDRIRADLGRCLPGLADPDMALNNFERMLHNVRGILSMVTFLLRKPHTLAVMMQMFATSQYFSELIIKHPEHFDFLWEHGHSALDPKHLRGEILAEIRSLGELEDQRLAIVRRHRQRELLRVGYRDIVLGEPLDRITESISDLADCLVEVALATAYSAQARRYGEPRDAAGKLARVCVLAMGKLGGRELNYSSDIDLMVLYDDEGKTDGRNCVTNSDFFAAVVRDLVRTLSANTPEGSAYRVDLRLRPHGDKSALCLSLKNTLAYYDQHGRTWERQALVKVRPIAGSIPLGEEFLRAIQPFVYRRFLSFVEINEIKAIKRRIEAKTQRAGEDQVDLKTGIGGIRDIEFVAQFLQLVNGGALPEMRERNTLRALKKLIRFGCINQDEHAALETAYRFLRKAEHRLQFMFDLQTHRIPENPVELDKLAVRLGYLTGGGVRPGVEFLADLRAITNRNQGILKRLMLDLFPGDDREAPRSGEPETDLVLDPDPDGETIRAVLGRYRFADVGAAYKNLMQLASESVPFLSSIRCRHFLASIAPQLLRAVAEAPDPDMALVNLEKVTDSLGAKGVLWESFSFNPPFLKLYVYLCSWSQFLSEILINNPGMIDELLDALVFNRPPSIEELARDLEGLLKGAREVEPILHGFKNTRLLNIGAHDILGKHGLARVTRQLSELARVILAAVADHHYQRLVDEHGVPAFADDPGRTASYGLVGMGKFGGSELGYHSDLDVVLVYEADGKTVRPGLKSSRLGSVTSNQLFYTELAQRIVRTITRMGPYGRLYSVDLRLRPTGRSGSLVLPLDKFVEYYQGSKCQLWERQALTRAAVVHGEPRFAAIVQEAARRAIVGVAWRPELVDEILAMRKRLEASRDTKDLKRGPGGIVDVEFAAQLMQIRYGLSFPQILVPNIWDALDAIEAAGLWSADRARVFREGYTFLRQVESRIRIVYSASRDDVPDRPSERDKLALRLGYVEPGDPGSAVGSPGQRLTADIARHAQTIRRHFLEALAEERTR